MHAKNVKYEQFQDTLEKLKRKLDFRPLDSAEAYAFINKYYLPRLDTMPTKRRIFIHPLIGENFDDIFKRESIKLTKQFTGDSSKEYQGIAPQRFEFPIVHSNWNQHKLNNTRVVIDTQMLTLYKQPDDTLVEKIEHWHKKFGYGYMLISYPLYNKNTGRLVITEWIENAGSCGTGRDNKFWFKKVPGGWQAY
jgi:hypothetical protein